MSTSGQLDLRRDSPGDVFFRLFEWGGEATKDGKGIFELIFILPTARK